MSEHGLASDRLKQQYAKEIAGFETFRTHGVSEQEALRYLESPEGEKYLKHLKDAAPNAPEELIKDRAIGQLRSGRDLPRMEVIDEPLVKIVPAGVQDKSLPYSPFFAKESEFRDALARGHNLNDRFGLPIKSEAPVYDLYRIDPKGPTEVFVSEVAPTSELGGQVRHAGGGTAVGALSTNVAGEKVADRWDQRQIYTQTARDGVSRQFNGCQWLRQDQADLSNDGVDAPQRQAFATLPDDLPLGFARRVENQTPSGQYTPRNLIAHHAWG